MKTFKPLNLENVRSYASVTNLENALAKYEFDILDPILVGVPNTTRVTALFSFNTLMRLDVQPITLIQRGFAVIS